MFAASSASVDDEDVPQYRGFRKNRWTGFDSLCEVSAPEACTDRFSGPESAIRYFQALDGVHGSDIR